MIELLSHSIETPTRNSRSRSIEYESGRYEVVIPWKDDRSVLPYNYDTARRRLSGTEKCIPNEPEERSGNEDSKNREKSNWVLLHTTLSCYKAGKSNDGDVRCF